MQTVEDFINYVDKEYGESNKKWKDEVRKEAEAFVKRYVDSAHKRAQEKVYDYLRENIIID